MCDNTAVVTQLLQLLYGFQLCRVQCDGVVSCDVLDEGAVCLQAPKA